MEVGARTRQTLTTGAASIQLIHQKLYVYATYFNEWHGSSSKPKLKRFKKKLVTMEQANKWFSDKKYLQFCQILHPRFQKLKHSLPDFTYYIRIITSIVLIIDFRSWNTTCLLLSHPIPNLEYSWQKGTRFKVIKVFLKYDVSPYITWFSSLIIISCFQAKLTLKL